MPRTLPDLLPVLCALLLYAARIREFFVKHDVIRGEISERATFRAMLVSGTLVVFASVVEYLVRHLHFNAATFIPGVLVAALSFAIRGAAVHALGRMWSVHIEIRPRHQLVRTGPFRWVRHPIYLAAILELVGAMLLLDSAYTWLLFAFFFAPSLLARIRLEERAMIARLGDDYRRYRETTPALLPWRGPTC